MEGKKAIEGAFKRMANRPNNNLTNDEYWTLQETVTGWKNDWENDWENDSEWYDAGIWGQQD